MGNCDEGFHGKILFDCAIQIREFECKGCPCFKTNGLASLKHHLRNGHRNESSEEYVYTCLKCIFVTNSKFIMFRHTFICGMKNERLNAESITSTNKNQENHHWSSSGEGSTKLKSSFCESSGSNVNSAHLSLNKNANLEDIRRFACDQCPSRFKQKGTLKRHVTFRHTAPEDIRWFSCDHCPSKFKQTAHLKAHMVSYHTKPEDIQWLTCDQCSSKFNLKKGLLTHLKLCHRKPEEIRWFKCDQCSSKFKRKSNLNLHTKLNHSNPDDIKWFRCHHCSNKFNRNGTLKKHIKSCHTKPEHILWCKCEECTSKVKEQDISCRLNSEDGRPFLCELCPSRFKLKGTLKRHVRFRHSNPEDIQWFACHHCSALFKQTWHLKKHVASHHSRLEDN